jgi:hypothetical protein
VEGAGFSTYCKQGTPQRPRYSFYLPDVLGKHLVDEISPALANALTGQLINLLFVVVFVTGVLPVRVRIVKRRNEFILQPPAE